MSSASATVPVSRYATASRCGRSPSNSSTRVLAVMTASLVRPPRPPARRIFRSMAITEPPAHVKSDKGLQADALGLAGNIVIGLASVAPAYSLAATLGYVVVAVGEKSPSMFVLAFIPMLLVAFAYRELSATHRIAAPRSPGALRRSGRGSAGSAAGDWPCRGSSSSPISPRSPPIYLYRFLGLDSLAGVADRQGAARLFFHHRHDADQRPRHRDVRTHPKRAHRNPVRRAHRRQRHRAGPGVRRHRRRTGDHAAVELAVAHRPGHVRRSPRP